MTDKLLLRVLCVASGLHLSLLSLGERNAEHSEVVTIRSLGLREGLDQGVPLLDEGAQLVSGDVHAVEVGVAVEGLDLLALNLHLSPGLVVGVLVEVTERDLENATAEGVSSDL